MKLKKKNVGKIHEVKKIQQAKNCVKNSEGKENDDIKIIKPKKNA